MSTAITFYFDFISHNAYLAWTQIHKVAGRHGREVEPVPVLFAAFLDHHAMKGPAEVPAKSRWMTRNVLRKAAELDVPLQPPHAHPFNPLLALRVSSIDMPATDRKRVIDAIYRATWAESVDVSDADELAGVLTAAGFDARDLLERSQDDSIKQRLRDNGEAALARGVFGVPTMIVGGELFWGLDDLHFLDRFLAGRDPCDASRLKAWRKVRASARRRP